jgi:flagellar hook-associated protein 1 FlgK
MLGRANALVAQINGANAFIDAQRGDINTQIGTVVRQVNSNVQRIQELNQRIVEARAANPGHQPNDLLDQRDQVLRELNQLVEVRSIEQDGVLSLAIGNGQMLLSGARQFPLQAVPSAADPSRVAIAYTLQQTGGNDVPVEMAEASIKGGKLGGLLQYRAEVLDSAQNELGRMATAMAIKFNEVHETGYTQNGNGPGISFFSVGQPTVIISEGNQASLNVSVANVDALTAHDYKLSYDGTNYVLTDMTTGDVKNPSLSFPGVVDGLNIAAPAGTVAPGDSWTIQPTRNAAGSLAVALTDASQIAASGSSVGGSDGNNALALAQLRTAKTMGGGTLSFTEAYSSVVNSVAIYTQSNNTAITAQEALVAQNLVAQQSVSGVNQQEEELNLTKYQQMYQAASRMIEVSAAVFDALLSIRA